MKKILLSFQVLMILTFGLIFGANNILACSRSISFSHDELFDNSDLIIRATAVKYFQSPANPNIRTTGKPDSVIEFKVEERLFGKEIPKTINLNGYLSDKDDFNELPVPYTFVRRNGRSGSCFANTYKEGGQFLLFLKKTESGYTSNISALGPTNEQLRSEKDPWLIWVREQLKSKTEKTTAEIFIKYENNLKWDFLGV